MMISRPQDGHSLLLTFPEGEKVTLKCWLSAGAPMTLRDVTPQVERDMRLVCGIRSEIQIDALMPELWEAAASLEFVADLSALLDWLRVNPQEKILKVDEVV